MEPCQRGEFRSLIIYYLDTDVARDRLGSQVWSTPAYGSDAGKEMTPNPLREVLIAARSQLAALDVSFRRLINSSCSVFSLPDEILCQIFEIIVLDGQYDVKPSSRSIRRSQNQVIGTCSRWRSTALASPSLWRRITLDRYHTSEADAAAYDTSPVLFDLEHSKDCPLSLYLDVNDVLPRWTNILRPIVASICDRLQDVYVSWSVPYFRFDTVASDLKKLMLSPRIRSFALKLHVVCVGTPTPHLDLSAAKHIQRMDVHCRIMRFPRWSCDLRVPPFWAVRTLTLGGDLNKSNIVGAINSCTQLELLSVSCPFGDSTIVDEAARPLLLKPQSHLVSLSLFDLDLRSTLGQL